MRTRRSVAAEEDVESLEMVTLDVQKKGHAFALRDSRVGNHIEAE